MILMPVSSKTSMFGNPFIGIFAKTNDTITLMGVGASDRFVRHIDVLQTEIVKLPIYGCELIGIYSVMNNKGVVISSMAEAIELKRDKPSINMEIMKTKFSAIGNNIVANDYGALVNPDMSAAEADRIKDILDVEVVRSTVAGYKTVGAVVAATNNGFISSPKTASEELDMMASLFHVQGGTGTANTGVPFLGISILANKKGFVVGEQTTGFEFGRINDCLGFI